jgi:hypothetical protein
LVDLCAADLRRVALRVALLLLRCPDAFLLSFAAGFEAGFLARAAIAFSIIFRYGALPPRCSRSAARSSLLPVNPNPRLSAISTVLPLVSRATTASNTVGVSFDADLAAGFLWVDMGILLVGGFVTERALRNKVLGSKKRVRAALHCTSKCSIAVASRWS